MREQTDQDLLAQVNRFSTLLVSEEIEVVKNAAIIESPGRRGEKGVLPFSLVKRTGLFFIQHGLLEKYRYS